MLCSLGGWKLSDGTRDGNQTPALPCGEENTLLLLLNIASQMAEPPPSLTTSDGLTFIFLSFAGTKACPTCAALRLARRCLHFEVIALSRMCWWQLG